MNPKQTLEQAAEAYLVSESLTLVTNIYKGIENETAVDDDPDVTPTGKALPFVIVESGDCDEQVPGTGTWKTQLFVRVEADAHNTTDTVFDTYCDEVFDKFFTSTACDDLSAAKTGFHAYELVPRGASGIIKNGQNWQNTLVVDVVFSESDLT